MTLVIAVDNEGEGRKKRDFEEMENTNSRYDQSMTPSGKHGSLPHSSSAYSPLKRRSFSWEQSGSSHHTTNAVIVEAATRQELHQDFFCDTPDFLTKRFEADEGKIGAILTKVKKEKTYKNSRWDHLPQGNVAEAALLEGNILPDLLPGHLFPGSANEHLPLDRGHTRLVLETGRPIIFAKSLLEFVGAMRDAIKGEYPIPFTTLCQC